MSTPNDPYGQQPDPNQYPGQWQDPNAYPGQIQPYGQDAFGQPQQYGQDPYLTPQYPSQPYPNQPYPNQVYPGQPYPMMGQPQAGTNGLAIAALVCGIVSYPLGCAYGAGVLTAIAGLIMGLIALNQLQTSGQEGRGMALAGAICSGVFLALILIVVIAAFALGLSILGAASSSIIAPL